MILFWQINIKKYVEQIKEIGLGTDLRPMPLTRFTFIAEE